MTGNFDIEKRLYDSSAITDYAGCPKLFELVWLRRLELKEVVPALMFGGVMHDVMRVWYKTGDAEFAAIPFVQIPSVTGDDYKTKEWGEAIFKQYVLKYPLESEQGKTLGLETQFVVEIKGRLYGGRIDRIQDWKGQIYVDDHKTTRSLGLSFFDGFRPSFQIDGYCYACRELMGKCHGAIINGLSTAKHPKERFMRFPSSRTDKELDRFADTFTDWTEELERDLEENHFPCNYGYCNRWFKKCKFWEYCTYDQDEKWLDQTFKVAEEWKPSFCECGNEEWVKTCKTLETGADMKLCSNCGKEVASV